MAEIPPATRPSLSGYIQPGEKLLPWKWVDHRMVRARNYWVTTHASGFPSSRPVWGLWWAPEFVFSTGGQIGKNLARNPAVQVNLESGDELVIVEGLAELSGPPEHARRWEREYAEKYNWDEVPPWSDAIIVRPKRILAWICDSSGLDDGVGFNNSATEWRFS